MFGDFTDAAEIEFPCAEAGKGIDAHESEPS